MDYDSDDQASGTDDDEWSDTSSEITQIDTAEFPGYFEERNGRLFHSHGSSPYPLPVDTAEQDRLNGQHILLEVCLGGNYVGPVREVLRRTRGVQRRALDLGTGTGTWVLDMAAEFPHVKFHGIDIVPIATQYPPQNVVFEMQDINEPFRYGNNQYDLVHARSITMAVRNYPALVGEVARILRRGGLFVACEWGPFPAIAQGGDLSTPLPYTTEFFRIFNNILRDRGIGPIAPQLSGYLERSGHFDDICRYRVEMSIGDNPLGDTLRDVMRAYAESMEVVLLEAGWPAGHVNALVVGYLHEMDTVPGMVFIYYAVHARKR